MEGLFTPTFLIVNTCGFESLKLIKDGFVSFKKVEGLNPMKRRAIKAIKRKLKRMGVILNDEVITRVVEEEGFADDIL